MHRVNGTPCRRFPPWAGSVEQHEEGAAVSDNLRTLAEYSSAIERGDSDAVFDFWAPEFHSHVTTRVSPDKVGSDVRGEEQKWWETAGAAFGDMVFTVTPLIEQGDLVVSNWTVGGTDTGGPFYDVPPSGERVVINGTAILRMRGGKILEHWGGPHRQEGLGLIR